MHTTEEKKIPRKTYKVYEIDLEDSHGAEVTLQIGKNSDIALVDTGAYCSCMSEESYNLHNTAPLRAICNINVKTASGTNLEPLGIAECNFKLGTATYIQPFIVCRKLTRNFILDRDFLRTNRLHVGWSNEGRFRVQSGKEVLIEAISVETQPVVTMKKNITVPPRTLVVVEMQTVIPSLEGVGYYDFMPTERYVNQEVNLVMIPVAYYTTTAGKQQILQVIINLEEVPIKVSEGTIMGHL